MELLPSYKELKSRIPTTPQQDHFIEESRQTVRRILNGTDPRLLLIVGPCSIHDPASAKEFALQLKALADSVSSQFFILMRVYCEKPRTATGWKGFLYDPLLNGSNRLLLGIEHTRQLLIDLAELHVPAATEFLDPLTAFYYDDLITWGSIGARTASSQTHRQLASNLQMPIGFKNGVAGNISAAINGVLAASQQHTHMALHENGWPAAIQTPGNPDAHIVLRGGESKPNYDPSSVAEALSRLALSKLPKRLLIDCSHHNSNKKHERQLAVFQSVVHQIIEGNTHIRGLMLESHLHAGNQPLLNDPHQLSYGVSITDACLDWDSTSRAILWGFHQLVEHSLQCQQACSSESVLSPL